MKDRKLGRLFERYRRRGDVEALGQVFDLASEELLRLAMFLAPSPAEAEDLLQATFLTAIERAERYDGMRALMPWLLGILAHHAHEARRRARQSPDPARLEARDVPEPHAEFEALELEHEIERALAQLSDRERELLEPFLRQGKAPIVLAREHGLAPGTVRMRIHRALARLRELLPASLALGGALTVGAGRGYPALRASVIEAGARAVPRLAAAGAGTASIAPYLFGGSFVAKKTLLAALSLALLGVLGWLARDELGGARTARPVAPTGLELAEPTGDSASVDLAAPDLAPSEPSPAAPARVAVVERAKEPANAYQAALSGVTGRLVEPDGRPAAGVDMRLLEIPLDRVQAWLGADLGSPSLLEQELARGLDPLVARTRTDEQGRFVLRGARFDALHAIGGGAASPRVPLRVVAEPLEPGTLVDLGDVALRARVALRGAVQDEQGRPLEGVRVRAGTLPNPLFELGILDLGPGTPLAWSLDEPPLVVALPAWIAGLQEHLSLAETRTDREGRFELADLPAGELDLLLDRPGFVAQVMNGIPLAAGGESDIGTPTLRAGRTVRGRVLESDGTPRPGVPVFAGASGRDAGAPFFPLVASGKSDVEGRFELGGLAGSASWIVACRADQASPWTVVRFLGEGECELRLPERGTLTLRVEDERGTPVSGAKIRIDPDPRLTFLPAALVRAQTPTAHLRATGPGTYVAEGLARGRYNVSASAPGRASEHVAVALEAGSAEATLVLAPVRRIAVRVLDAETALPVPDALVVLGAREIDGLALSSARSGHDGLAELEVRRRGGREPAGLCLRAAHPGYATSYVDELSDGATEELLLSAGGALSAALDPVPPPDTSPLLALWLNAAANGFEAEGLRMLRLDERGTGRLAHLAPGRWHYELTVGWAKDADMGELLGGGAPDQIESGELEIRAGETTELLIRHALRGSQAQLGGGTGNVAGRILLDGEPAQGLCVGLQGEQVDGQVVDIAPDGTFSFSDVPAGELYLSVRPSTRRKRYLTESQFVRFERFELAPGESKRFELAWPTTRVVIETRDMHGDTAPDVQLDLEGPWGRTTVFSDRAGRADFALIGVGRFELTASSREAGIGRTALEVRAGERLDPIEVRLRPGVPCAGRVRIEGTAQDGQAVLYLRAEQGDPLPVPLEVSGGAGSFRAVGLEPGKHEAYLYGLGVEFDPAHFELAAEGDESLELVFGLR